MDREIFYSEALQIVIVKTSGNYILKEELGTVKKAVAKMKQHHCSRCLFDHRNATVIITPLDSIQRPKQYAELGVSREMKIASLVNDASQTLKFYELANSNRGWKMAIFDDYDAAIDWLNS